MKLKTLQWNIGGGKIRGSDSDIVLDTSYSLDGVDYIISKLKDFDADIVTLQESHAKGDNIQAEYIAREAGYRYWINDEYDDSHVEKGQRLCQSILSKYPINQHTFEFFNNPHFEVRTPQGEMWISHDKGLSSVAVQLPDAKSLHIGTLHMVPFRRFNREFTDMQVQNVLEDVSEKIQNKLKDLYLIQGDFNIDRQSLRAHFPKVLALMEEIEVMVPTTPKGRKYDHILYKGFKPVVTKIYDGALTDHYPVYNEFEI